MRKVSATKDPVECAVRAIYAGLFTPRGNALAVRVHIWPDRAAAIRVVIREHVRNAVERVAVDRLRALREGK